MEAHLQQIDKDVKRELDEQQYKINTLRNAIEKAIVHLEKEEKVAAALLLTNALKTTTENY